MVNNRRPRVRLDWREYYERFKQAHGEPPDYVGVRYREDDAEYVLFPDGWRWGMSKGGPEYPPPSDRVYLLRLKAYYYRARLSELMVVRDRIRTLVDNLKDVQREYSMPLIEQVRYATEDDGKRTVHTDTQELDLFALEHRLKTAQKYLDECQTQLNEILNESNADNKAGR